MTEPQPAECTNCHGYDSSTCLICRGTGQQPDTAAIEAEVRAELDRPGAAHFTRNEIRAVLAELDRARAALAAARTRVAALPTANQGRLIAATREQILATFDAAEGV